MFTLHKHPDCFVGLCCSSFLSFFFLVYLLLFYSEYLRSYFRVVMSATISAYSGKAADIEEFRSVVTRGKGDNYKNRHGVTVIL